MWCDTKSRIWIDFLTTWPDGGQPGDERDIWNRDEDFVRVPDTLLQVDEVKLSVEK